MGLDPGVPFRSLLFYQGSLLLCELPVSPVLVLTHGAHPMLKAGLFHWAMAYALSRLKVWEKAQVSYSSEPFTQIFLSRRLYSKRMEDSVLS